MFEDLKTETGAEGVGGGEGGVDVEITAGRRADPAEGGGGGRRRGDGGGRVGGREAEYDLQRMNKD